MKSRHEYINRPSYADAVKQHYEKWPFPDVSFGGNEGLILLRYLHEILDGGTPGTKRVIDIGCGTGHGTVAIAVRFPDVNFVGLDLSAASIQKAGEIAGENNVRNIKFMQGDIRDRSRLPGGEFDLTLCTGVLHHIENARDAFANLAGLVRPGGKVILWLYGRYGRARHRHNQAFIELLSRDRTPDEREQIAREFVIQLGEQYAADTGFYTPRGSGNAGLAWLLNHGQWLADQMIPPYEHCYTMNDILALFHDNGFNFAKWLGVSINPESYTTSPILLDGFTRMTADEQLLAIDLLIKPEYYFVSGRKRSEATNDHPRN